MSRRTHGRNALLPVALSTLLTACGGGGDDAEDARKAAIVACQAKATTVTIQGVAGCTFASTDVGPNLGPWVSANVEVRLYGGSAAAPTATATPLQTTRSDATGYFEMTFRVGDYWLCAGAQRCTAIFVGVGQRVTRYYESGLASGWN